MAKKKQSKQPPKLTTLNYIKTKARTLPITNCYINSNWKEVGMANIVVARKHVSGNYTMGIYLVDVFCIGLLETFVRFNESQELLDDIVNTFLQLEEEQRVVLQVDYTLVHNIIYGGIAFAEENKYKPHKHFEVTQYILEEDDDKIELMDLEFGVNGEPFFILRDENGMKIKTKEELEAEEKKKLEQITDSVVS